MTIYRVDYQMDGRWQREPDDYPSLAAAKRAARAGARGRHWRVCSIPDPEEIRAMMSYIGSIRSERKAAASRENGKKGGRPRKGIA